MKDINLFCYFLIVLLLFVSPVFVNFNLLFGISDYMNTILLHQIYFTLKGHVNFRFMTISLLMVKNVIAF